MTENLNNDSVDEINNQYHEELLKNQKVENTLDENEMSFSHGIESSLENKNEPLNDLKEFGVDTREPDLFNSDDPNPSSDNLLETSEEENEEDDLEIPAFLRRQKN